MAKNQQYDIVLKNGRVIDPETYSIVDTNHVAEEMIGAPRKDIIGTSCRSVSARPFSLSIMRS